MNNEDATLLYRFKLVIIASDLSQTDICISENISDIDKRKRSSVVLIKLSRFFFS